MDDPVKYGLTDGFPMADPTDKGLVFGLSMYHQLHCLVSRYSGLREIINYEKLTKLSLKASIEGALKKDSGSHDHQHAHHEYSDHHLPHCIDYLRQVSDTLTGIELKVTKGQL